MTPQDKYRWYPATDYQARPQRRPKWSLADVLFAAAMGIGLGIGIAEYLSR